jgi:hypothetical protein
MEIKSKFIGKNPFTGIKNGAVDPSKIVIDNGPMPKKRRTVGKYDDLFDKLEFGQNMIVPMDSSPQVSQALRGYLKRNRKLGKVRTFSYQPTSKTAQIFLVKP